MPGRERDYILLEKPPFRYHHPFVDIAEVAGTRRLYYGQWLWFDFSPAGGKIARSYAAIFDDGAMVVETGAGELEEVGIRLRRVPAEKPESRWPTWAIKKFLDGEPPNPDEMDVYDLCKRAYENYIDYGDEWGASMLMSLYTIQSYLTPIFSTLGYIGISGPKRSGKSKNLDVAEQVCFNPVKAVNLTAASLFRIVDGYRATVLIDESDFKSPERHRDILIMLRAGYRRGEYVVRQAKVQKKGEEKFKEELFDVFGPKILVVPEGIEEMLRDRCIMINMQRTANPSITRRYVDPRDPIWEDIRAHLYYFGLKHWREVEQEYMRLDPGEISGREYEKWAPLLALAKVFGVYDDLYKYALEKIHETYLDEEAEAPAIKLLRICLHIYNQEKDEYTDQKPVLSASQIAEKAEELLGREKWIKPGTIGNLMTNVFGFNRRPWKRVKHGTAVYVLDPKKLKALAKRYNVDPDNPLEA